MDSEGYDVIDAEYTEDDKTWRYKLEDGVNDERVYFWGDVSLEVYLEPFLEITRKPDWNSLPMDMHEA